MQAKLIPLHDGPTIVITRDVTVVGRKKGICDLLIDHPSVSKLHCLVARTDGLLFIRDLGSTNGTKVNGQRVLRGAILPGDELAFAKVKYKVYLGPDEKTGMVEQVSPLDRTECALPTAPAAEPRDLENLSHLANLAQDSDEDFRFIDDDEED